MPDALSGGDITEHGRTQPTYLCRADGRRNMVVTRCDIRHDGAERIERRIVAFFYLALHILLNLVHGHVAGTFDESLHIHTFLRSVSLIKSLYRDKIVEMSLRNGGEKYIKSFDALTLLPCSML